MSEVTDLHYHLTEAGVDPVLLGKANAHGITTVGVLQLILKYGPTALTILQDILNQLGTPTTTTGS